VAILDTGVHFGHEEVLHAEDVGNIRKTRCRGFPETLDPTVDKYGHGTQVASILLKTSPKVELYIARVADDAGEIPPDEDYKEVAKVNQSSSTNQ
jgi:hypothetical protein